MINLNIMTFLIILMGAIGLPLTNGFIGEFLLLKGIFSTADYGIWYAIAGGTTLIFGAVSGTTTYALVPN